MKSYGVESTDVSPEEIIAEIEAKQEGGDAE